MFIKIQQSLIASLNSFYNQLSTCSSSMISSVMFLLTDFISTFLPFFGASCRSYETISWTLSFLSILVSQFSLAFCIFLECSSFSFSKIKFFPYSLNESSSNENYWETNFPERGSNTILCLNFYVSTNFYLANNLSIAFCLDSSSSHWFSLAS